MIESKLSFFEMQIESTLGQAVELGHPSFCIAPKAFDAVDVTFARGELIGPVVDSEMLVKADIDQTIVTGPAVGMDDRSWVNVTPDNPLKSGLGAVRHDFRIDHALTFEQPKDNRLAVGTAPTPTTNRMSAKVGLVHFNRSIQRRSQFTGFSQSLADLQVDRIHRTQLDTRYFRSHRCCQIHRKTPRQLAKLSLADSRTAVVPVFSNHFRKLS